MKQTNSLKKPKMIKFNGFERHQMKDKELEEIANILGWVQVLEGDMLPYQVGWYVEADGKTAHSPKVLELIIAWRDKAVVDGLEKYIEYVVNNTHQAEFMMNGIRTTLEEKLKELTNET